jgi:hypothetical protein
MHTWKNMGTETTGCALAIHHAHKAYSYIWRSGMMDIYKITLDKLQRKAYTAVTGAFQTAPTVTIEMMLGLDSICSAKRKPCYGCIDSAARAIVTLGI